MKAIWWPLAIMFLFIYLLQLRGGKLSGNFLYASTLEHCVVSLGVVLAVAMAEVVLFSFLLRYILFRLNTTRLKNSLRHVIPSNMTGEVVVLTGGRMHVDLFVIAVVSLFVVWSNQYCQYMYMTEVAMNYIASPQTAVALLYVSVRGISVWGVHSFYISPDFATEKALFFRGNKSLGILVRISDGIQMGKRCEMVMLEFSESQRRCVVFPSNEIARMRLLFDEE